MYVWLRHLRTLWLFAAISVVALPARAWVETSLQSHLVTIDVERDGRAVVAHELLIKVRGGPLRGIELPGVDSDAELLPDATVAPAASNSAAGAGHPLVIERREDRSLKIEVDHERGLRRGTYLFKLRYRTHLVERELVRSMGSLVEVRWVGPRLEGGVDSARVVFRLPPAPTPPRIPEASDLAMLGVDDEPLGTFLSTLRRAPDKDELEVVRPHVAAGEPVEWRVLASPKAFDAFAPAEPVPALEAPPAELPAPPARRALWIAIFAGIALAYGCLILLKWRAVSRASEERDARARAIVPLPAPLRAALSGALLGGAVAVAALTRMPTLAGALLLGAIVLAAHAAPRLEPKPRGPGRWLPLSDEDAFSGRAPKLPGRYLDAGSPLGFCLFVVALAGFAMGALLLLPRSPYHALLVAIGSASLLPIFCTGRGGELPIDPVHGPRALLGWLVQRLRDHERIRTVAWARIPDGSAEPDELRLLVMPRQPVAGLGAIEVGLESVPGSGGPIAAPWVIVRALDGSPAHRALAPEVAWTRGRRSEERVAIVRPKLPTRAMCLALVLELAGTLTETRPAVRRTRQPTIEPKRAPARRSAGLSPGAASWQ